jgi:hypothetical protein
MGLIARSSLVAIVLLASASMASAQSKVRVSGKVLYKGAAVSPKEIDTHEDPKCAAHGKVTTEDLLVNEDGTLKNVMVFVKEGLEGKEFEAPKDPVTLQQHDCRFDPHVFGVMVDQQLKITNNDDTFHNVRGTPAEAPPFNLAQFTKGASNSLTFKAAEKAFAIQCDVHGWMKTYCWVFEHPYFSVTGAKGTFSLPPLAPGNYTLAAWHEKLGMLEQKITIEAGKKPAVEFTFEEPKK